MRRVGDFETEKHALRFWSYLKKKGIDSSLEKADSSDSPGWEIWVAEEDLLGSAHSYLNEFLANPDDERFLTSSKSANADFPKTPKKKSGFKQFNLGKKWSRSDRSPGTMTLSLVITCVAVFLLSGMGKNTEMVGGFFISEKMDGRLSEFLSGEVWRI